MAKILILGGGFGGVRVALDLSKKLGREHSIALIDKNNSQTFHPSLYEVASVYGINHEHPYHTKLRGTVCIPYGKIFDGKKIELIQAEVSHIDLQAKHVVTHNGATIEFDYLVLAFGSVVSTFGIPGVEEYAFKFKTIEDALMVNDKIEQLYIQAGLPAQAGQKNRSLPINILICGAGFNGIELAAELSGCATHIAHRHSITQQNCTAITLIEASPAILPMVSEKERGAIRGRLIKLGVNILTNSPIEEIGPDHVKLKGGKVLAGDLIIWTAGVKAVDLFRGVVGLELDDRGHIFVNQFLQIKNHADFFAVGDNIVFIDEKTQKPIPQMAFLAIEQGRVAAENIARIVVGKSELKKYQPAYNVWVAPVGGQYALAHLGGWNFSGFLGYVIRGVVDFRYFQSIMPFFKAVKLFLQDVEVFSKND